MHSLAGPLLALVGAACTSVAEPDEPPELTVLAPDGVSIAYEVRGDAEPTLVFVHGWCCDRTFWRGMLEAFDDTHRVVALDLGGHGRSGATRSDWTLAALAGDVTAVVEALPSERVILIGHSMGATVALLAAQRLAPRVLGVVGVDALHDADFAYPPGYLEQASAALEADFPRALGEAMNATLPLGSPPELRDWIVERALRTDRGAALGLLAGLEGFRLGPALAAAGVPVRVINAAPRPGAPATELERNRALCDFDASILEGVGHFPMLEQPLRFRAALARYVAELAQTTGR